MMLVEEGKVGLDDSIVKYFPDTPATWKPILIKNLLSHTSGLAEYESGERIGRKGPSTCGRPDPATGDFGLSVPIDSVDTVKVMQSPYLAQYGNFTAGVVSAETRRGGDK
jgi:CubicO group peptidase (beta-lactamase class C family)